MGFVGDIVKTIFGGGDEPEKAGRQAAEGAARAEIEGAEIQAESQREALEYLKEREALPRQFSETALKGLAGLYGMPGGTGSQQDLIQQAISSPLYQSMMGGREAGEEAILRSASATGGLRSGNVQSAMYDYNTQLQNQALLQSYNQQLQGLTGLAALPSYAPQIARGMEGIGETLGRGTRRAGQTRAEGLIGSTQAGQASGQQGWGNLMGLGELAVSIFSDRRLKKNIKKVCTINGFNWYTWDWNIVAQKMGLKGSSEGVMADEVFQVYPDAISFKNLFMLVDYSKIGNREVCDA